MSIASARALAVCKTLVESVDEHGYPTRLGVPHLMKVLRDFAVEALAEDKAEMQALRERIAAAALVEAT